jgi:hypothetical protein
MTLAEIEQAKHAASWLNSALAVICFLLALILHKIGSDILAGIRV